MTAWWLTWLWQGLALTLAVQAALRALPRLNAATRYAIWWSALAAVGALGLPAVTTISEKAGELGGLGDPDTHLLLVPSAPPAFVAIVLGVWAAVALVRLARLLPGIHAVNRLRDRCRAFPGEIEAQLPMWLEARARGRHAQLMLCDAVPGAAVLGFCGVYIVVPPSLLTALGRSELDQVILHEYAHVQRWDEWTRLAQELVHAVLWIHPAAAFITKQLNIEREIACDESVVARTESPKAYARCLTRAAEVSRSVCPMLGPGLFGRKHDLVCRVERLLTSKGHTREKMSALATLTGACALLAMMTQLHALPLVAEIGEIELPAFEPPRYGAAGTVFAPNGPSAPSPAFALVEFPRRASRVRLGVAAPIAPAAASGGAVQSDAAQEVPRLREDRNSDASDSDAPRASGEADALPSLSARPFEVNYSVAPATALAETPSVWRKASTAGVRFADTFARAGVSLARRF